MKASSKKIRALLNRLIHLCPPAPHNELQVGDYSVAYIQGQEISNNFYRNTLDYYSIETPKGELFSIAGRVKEDNEFLLSEIKKIDAYENEMILVGPDLQKYLKVVEAFFVEFEYLVGTLEKVKNLNA